MFKEKLDVLFQFLVVVHVPPANVDSEEFITYAAASHKRVVAVL